MKDEEQLVEIEEWKNFMEKEILQNFCPHS